MTKKQKIWFAVFAAMFLIPEILWGFFNTFFCGALFNGNGVSNISLLPAIKSNEINKLIVGIQFSGIFFSFIFCLFFYRPTSIVLKAMCIFILGCLALLMLYLLFFVLNFNPQIG